MSNPIDPDDLVDADEVLAIVKEPRATLYSQGFPEPLVEPARH